MRVRRPADPLRVLETPEGYRARFMDPVLWGPSVREVCARHGLPEGAIRPGLAGSYPTFIVDERIVVKFFGRLFDGWTSWRVESSVAGLVAGLAWFGAPRLLASGREGEWPYLAFRFVPGASIGEARRRVRLADRRALARRLGRRLRELHAIEGPGSLPRLTRRKLECWYDARKRQGMKGVPRHLARQADAFLASCPMRVGAAHLIHADLTADHVLGEIQGGRWRPRGIIDFGDAMRGNLFYELCALHLDLFAADRRLLAAFLGSYGPDPEDQRDFARKAMRMALMHRFDVLGPVFARRPALSRLGSLEEVADTLWNP